LALVGTRVLVAIRWATAVTKKNRNAKDCARGCVRRQQKGNEKKTNETNRERERERETNLGTRHR